VARNILRDGRLLVPVEVEALEPPPALQRLGGVPGHVRINHQVDVVAYEGADGLYPFLVLAGVRASDLHLDAGKPLCRKPSVCASSSSSGFGRSTPEP
jgi:hypothetical protein